MSSSKKGQRGPQGRTLHGSNYPLTDREQELAGEVQTPTIPAVYKRTMTIQQTEGSEQGVVTKAGRKVNVTKLSDAWDNVAPLSEENMHQKFVKLGAD